MEASLAHLYVLARLFPLAWALAALGYPLVPRPIALSLSLALAHVLVPFAGSVPLVGRAQLALGLLRELCVGGVFALSLSLAMATAPWALQLAQPAGSRAPVNELARAYALCAAWLVLALGGLRAVVRALVESFRVLPIGGALDHQAFALGVTKLVAVAMAAAVAVALPFAIAAVLLELSAVLIRRVSVGSEGPLLLGPLLFLGLAALWLVPLVMRAPEWLRFALEAAQALTRTLAK